MEHTYKPTKPFASVKLLVLLGMLMCLGGNVFAQITLTSTTGSSTSASYTTLKGAIDNINNGTHTGSIAILVHANTTETASAVLQESGTGSASYTSLLIRPADTATVAKIIDFSVSAATLLDLNGADFVTIDGRPLGQGTSKLLTFRHSTPNSSAASIVIRLINGVTNSSIRYINSTSLTTTATAAAININLSTSAAAVGNKNITIENCNITGGIQGINMTGTLANFMDSITIRRNTILNAQSSSIVVNAVKTLVLDSNIISHNSSFIGWNVFGLNINPNVSAANYTITKNIISNLQTGSAAQMAGILISPGTAGLAINPTVTLVNNSVSLLATNSGLTFARAMQFQGANASNVVCYHNTFRLGGSGAGTTANPATITVAKSNTSTASSFTFTNNILINTRTGAANPHIAYWNSTPTSGTNLSDFNTLFGVTFSAIANGFYQSAIAAYRAASAPNEQNSSFGLVDFVNSTEPTLNLSGVNNSGSILLGTPVGVTTDAYATARSITRPFKGAYESSLPLDTFDLQAVIIYTYGKIPIGTDDTVRVLVRNRGAAGVVNEPIHLFSKISGYIGSTNVTLSSGNEAIVKMVPYTPYTIGFDTLIANPNPDQKSGNDTAIWVRENTLNALSYSRPFVGQTGNVGTNPEGEIVAKFYTPVTNYISQVNVNFTNAFFNGPFQFQVVIYEDSGSTFGPKMLPMWVSSTQNTVNGIFNLSIPSIQISGSFYIGVRQTTANNIGFAFQNENPIRNNTFYFRQGAAYLTSVWNDFSVNATNQFRFMIEPRLTINDDLGVASLVAPGAGCVNLGTQPVTFQVQNLGLLSQNFSTDTLKLFGRITKPSGNVISFGPINVTSGFLASGNSIDVIAIPSFNFDSVGAYTFTAWTKFGPDANAINDTLPPFVRTVLAATNAPLVENFNAATFPTSWTTNRFFISPNNGLNNSNSIRVNLTNTTPFNANCFLQSPRLSGITANTILRFDYRILNNLGGTAANLINTDSIKILASTDCGNTFTQIALINGQNHIASANYTTFSAPLSAYVGNDLIIKIVYDWFGTTNDAIVDMDNIRFVDGVNDMSALAVLNPCRSVIGGSASVIPSITIKNIGSAAQNNIPVFVSITGPATYTANTTVASLASGASTNVSFASGFNPTTAGLYTLKAWTSLPGDGDLSNDTVIYTFNVTNVAANAGSLSGMQFGTSAMLSVKNNPTVHFNSAFSFEAWINRTTSATNRVIVAKDSATGFLEYSWGLNTFHQLELFLNTNSQFYHFTSTDVVPTGYTHVATTFNGTNAKFYINGTLVLDTNFSTSTMVAENYDVKIGNSAAANSGFIGTIDEVRMWNVERTDAEIRTNMHKRLATASSANLVAYYHFDEGAGNTFTTDISGNCNAAIFGNIAPTWVTALYPLGTPTIGTQTIIVDGSYTIGATDLSVTYANINGSDVVYAHKFTGGIIGTSPILTPGGVTNVHPNYWVLYRYGNATTNSTDVQLALGTGNLNSSVNTADLKLFARANGASGAWTNVNTSAQTASFATQSVTFAQTQAIYGQQLAVGANNNPLPVVMLYLNGRSSKLDAVVQWATASERNCKGFAIERSFDGKRFEEIGFVNGSGNSNTSIKYSFVDRGVFNGKTTAFYRLKQVDVDGGFTQSEVVVIKQSDVATEGVTVYPNPVKTELNIEIEALKTSKGTLTITDISGKVIVEQPLTIGEGFNKYTLPEVNSLKNGIYFVTITENNKNIFNGKVVKSE